MTGEEGKIQVELPATFPDDLSDVPQFMRDQIKPLHDEVLEAGVWKEMIHAYLATISFADAMIGRVLNALDESGLAENTAIVLWSDHGYHLGEKETWGKLTLWEETARAPLIVVDPDVEVPADGQRVDQVVELLDIFPTILELAGVAPAPWAEGENIPWHEPGFSDEQYKSLLADAGFDDVRFFSSLTGGEDETQAGLMVMVAAKQ